MQLYDRPFFIFIFLLIAHVTFMFYDAEPGLREKCADRHEYTYSLCEGYPSSPTFHLH